MTDEEKKDVKERIALSYFGGMIDSGGTIGVVKVGRKKKEVPIVRMRRPDRYAFDRMKERWGGSVIARGDSFEITIMYGKALSFLRAVRNNTIGRQREIDQFLQAHERTVDDIKPEINAD